MLQKSIMKTSRLTPYKTRLLTDAFIIFKFLCSPLIWMFASKGSINKIICKIHFRALQIVYNTHAKLYEELLPLLIYLCIKNTYVFSK